MTPDEIRPLCCPNCWSYGKAIPLRDPCPICHQTNATEKNEEEIIDWPEDAD